MDIVSLLSDPSAWAALLTLIALEVVLGIDNLVFIAIISNKLPRINNRLHAESGWAWRWGCASRCCC